MESLVVACGIVSCMESSSLTRDRTQDPWHRIKHWTTREISSNFCLKFHSAHCVSVSLEEKQTGKANLTWYSWNIHVYHVIKQQQQKLLQFQSSQSIQEISELLQGASHCAECWSWKEKWDKALYSRILCVCVCVCWCDGCLCKYLSV